MTEFFDITLTLSSDLPTWPKDPLPLFKHKEIAIDGAFVQVSKMEMSVHTGTHIDAPRHFVREGATVDEIPLHPLIGPVEVVAIEDNTITADVLRQATIPSQVKRILFKTKNSELWKQPAPTFQQDYVAIEKDAAAYLVTKGVELVGVDSLSVAPFTNLVPTHQTLLQANVVVIEGLNLASIEPGPYTLHCLPLKIRGADAAPARVILSR